MTTDKEALAKRWEGNDISMDDDLRDLTTQALGLWFSGMPNSFTVGDALLGDMRAALAIKDALYPGWPVNIDFDGDKWAVGLEHKYKNDAAYTHTNYFYGDSNTLSHAIMASLVRASGDGE